MEMNPAAAQMVSPAHSTSQFLPDSTLVAAKIQEWLYYLESRFRGILPMFGKLPDLDQEKWMRTQLDGELDIAMVNIGVATSNILQCDVPILTRHLAKYYPLASRGPLKLHPKLLLELEAGIDLDHPAAPAATYLSN
ncbi:hypothetical protein C0991_005650 [Blastosporella zonata]|nr:hypothetical protein C0991_005650 [Blastosporella zonata]